MLTSQSLYQGSEEGLDLADQKLLDIYHRKDLRIIIEALLLDETTPDKLYTDLFGLTSSEKEEYRKYFFNLPEGTSRLEIYEYVTRINEQVSDEFSVERKTLYNEVFNNGWEFIDYKFNKGRCIDIFEYGKTVFKEMMIALRDEAREGVNKKDIAKMRSVLNLMKAGTVLYSDKKKEEKHSKYTQMALQFVKDIQDAVRPSEEEKYADMVGAEVGQFGTVKSEIDDELAKQIKIDTEAIKDKK